MQVIPLSRNDTLGDMKNKTLVAVYQLQLELVNVNPADIHWQARIHMRRVKRHTQTRAGKRQGNRDVLAPLLEQQLPALPGLPSSLMSGCSAAVKGAMLTPASAAAPPAIPEKLGGKGIERRKESFPLFPCLVFVLWGVMVPWLPMQKLLLLLLWVSGSALGKKWYLGDSVK